MALQAVVRTLASTLSKVLAIAKFIYVGCTIFFFFWRVLKQRNGIIQFRVFFFKTLFIYLRKRAQVGATEGEREAGSLMSRGPYLGFYPRTLGS